MESNRDEVKEWNLTLVKRSEWKVTEVTVMNGNKQR